MRKLLFVVLFGIQAAAQGQGVFPFGGGGYGSDSPVIEKEVTPDVTPDPGQGQGQNTGPVVPAVVPMNPQDTMNKSEEIAVKKLELQAQRLKIEKELAELQGKKELSDEEKDIMRLKNENLRLIIQREQLLFEEELSVARKKKDQTVYPGGAVYGHDLFRNLDFEYFQKTNEITATEGYVLGSGDVVQVELWGSRYWSKAYVVSESGSIDIAGYQKIFVKGLTLKQARGIIGSRLGVGGADNSYSVTVTRPRMVMVNILGEVFKPGTYTLPATNSAFNALVSMGGPSNIGSVRNIYIKRDGRIQDSFDLYEYYLNVTHQRDVYLQNNDYIIVAPLQNAISVSGGVRRPNTYELKAGEGLNDLIEFAGGVYNYTYLKDVVVTRYTNNMYEVLSVNLDSLRKLGKDFILTGGESVSFKTVNADFQNIVLIRGGVSVPGSYKIKNGLRISALIKNANGLTSDAYLEKAYLVRTYSKTGQKKYITFVPKNVLNNPITSPDDIVLEDRDSIHIFRTSELKLEHSIGITGAIFKPFSSQYIKGLKLGEMVFMAGGLRPDADPKAGFVLRTEDDHTKRIISFEPGQIGRDSSVYNIEILPRDLVQIYSETEYLKQFAFNISGSVKLPGTYSYAENTRLFDLIHRAGGLQKTAFTKRALVTRTDLITGIKTTIPVNLDSVMSNTSSASNLLLAKQDEVQVFDITNFQDQYSLQIMGPLRGGGGVFEFSENTTVQSLIDRAGGLEVNAFRGRALITHQDLITGQRSTQTINLEDYLADGRMAKNLYLKRGDQLRIFDVRELINEFQVTIDGPVRRAGAYAYSDNMTLQNLIDISGGIHYIAAGSRIEIVRNFYMKNGTYQFLKPQAMTTPISYSLTLDSQVQDFMLQPFDRVFIRQNPKYEPVRTVLIQGAVYYPGYYALQGDNEKINSILKRAGGFKPSAFPTGAKLKRATGKGDSLNIVLNSRKALHRKRSHYNYILRNGDVITIPVSESIVTLTGDLHTENSGPLGVYYVKHKRAKYYIKKFGGGFSRTSDKKNVIVEYQGGARQGTRNYVLFKKYPKVKEGSKIIVNSKLEKINPAADARRKVNVDNYLNKLITRMTGILTFIGLYKVATAK